MHSASFPLLPDHRRINKLLGLKGEPNMEVLYSCRLEWPPEGRWLQKDFLARGLKNVSGL